MADVAKSGAIHLTIVTPMGAALDTWVDSVAAPGVLGEFEVLPGHTQLLTELGEGEVAYESNGTTGHFAVLGGFAEVGPDHVAILAEGAKEAGEIDLAHAVAQKEQYEKLLAEIGPDDPRYDDTRKKIKEYVALLNVGQKKKQ